MNKTLGCIFAYVVIFIVWGVILIRLIIKNVNKMHPERDSLVGYYFKIRALQCEKLANLSAEHYKN